MKKHHFLLLALATMLASACCCQNTEVPALPDEPEFQKMDRVVPAAPVKAPTVNHTK